MGRAFGRAGRPFTRDSRPALPVDQRHGMERDLAEHRRAERIALSQARVHQLDGEFEAAENARAVAATHAAKAQAIVTALARFAQTRQARR